MRKKAFTLLAVLTVAGFSLAKDKQIERIENQIKWLYPKLTFKEISRSPIPGIYEIWTGKDIFYTDGRYLIIGQIISPQGNLTQMKINHYRQKYAKKIDPSKIDLSKALVIGNGKKEVIEVSDPECPFCRRAEKFFEGQNVKRYVIFYPLPFHKKAKPLAVHILCSKDREKAYKEVMEGKLDSSSSLISCKEGEERLKQMEQIALGLEVRGTPTFWIKTKDEWKQISGANPKIKQMLKEQ